MPASLEPEYESGGRFCRVRDRTRVQGPKAETPTVWRCTPGTSPPLSLGSKISAPPSANKYGLTFLSLEIAGKLTTSPPVAWCISDRTRATPPGVKNN